MGIDRGPLSITGEVYRYVRAERHVPVTAIALALGLSQRQADLGLSELREYRLIDDSRDIVEAVRATSPILALGRLILQAMAGDPKLGLDAVLGPETTQQIVQHSTLLASAHHVAISVDCFTNLTETAVTMAAQNVTTYHARPLLGSTRAVQTIVEYAQLKGLPVTSVWSRTYLSAPESRQLRQWMQDRDVSTVVSPTLEARGLVIDDGRLGVLHHDLHGATVRTDCDSAVSETDHPVRPSRRLSILRGLVAGLGDEELAARANVSVKTVRRDIAALRELLDVGSRAGLVAAARMLHLA
ncbi:helix-turn-helix transcriptional regulator [Nocardia higoensis]|uniref:helix-turn-helix transcriptional regulator n=1 Tax=Nocardia higoensis TaxID=228599 RepID=UPI001E5708CF|nr:HTH domain-containing protein [Nocardia higoensis]